MKSESIGKIALALSKAQSKIEGAVKETTNDFYKKKYADLGSVIDAIRSPLAENELSYIQLLKTDENKICLITMLIHSSGEWLQSVYPIIVKDPTNPQAVGSAVTYARRYGLAAIVGVAQVDDDGNEAAGIKVDKPEVKPESKPLANYAPQTNKDYQVTENQLKRLYALQHKANMSHADLSKLISIKTNKKDAKELLKSEYDVICAILENQN